MINNNTIKRIKSLGNKKFRKTYNEFVAEGEKVVSEILQENKYEVSSIYCLDEVVHQFDSFTTDIQVVSLKELERISQLKTPNKVTGVFKIPELPLNYTELKEELVLGLDNINDPGNLGTIIRIADWFSIKHIICSKESVDLYNPKTVQATMGSISRVNIYYEELEEAIPELRNQNLDIFGTFLEGENIYKQNLPEKGLVIIGSESHGISENIARFVTRKIHIPTFNKDSMIDSLNASIATALVCSEFKRPKR